MSDARLADLSKAAGLSVDWIDADGRAQSVTSEHQRRLLEALGYPAQSSEQIEDSLGQLQHRQDTQALGPLVTLDQQEALDLTRYFPPGTSFELELEQGERLEGRLDGSGRLPVIGITGYHRLRIAGGEVTLAVAPAACPSVAQLAGRADAKIWGLSAQLYSLRRPRDGGLGNTQALESLVRSAARHGADAVAISPVHAMFSANLHTYSPYSPSSRLFFNVLHAAPGSVLGEEALQRAISSCGLGEELARLESLDLIDWPGVASSRMRILRQLHADFSQDAHPLRADFEAFRREGGDALHQHCRFEALRGFMDLNGLPVDWRVWPEQYRDPASEAVTQFCDGHEQEIEFHTFAQWLIARCLDRAQSSARDAGMAVGLIADLAVGADASGSQAWARQSELLQAVSVGAPPDILNRSGQNWGVSAFSPQGLQSNGFRAYIEMLRANLAHAGGMRIDHVMSMRRLWVIPDGEAPGAGAYLNYPSQDLLRLLCLEAERHGALIIGEDLGTVPDGLREELARRNILGMRVLLFEQSNGHFHAPTHWPRDALATTTTHDLPSIRGWFASRDIDWRQTAGHRSDDYTRQDHDLRAHETRALRQALQQHGHVASDETDDEQQQLDASIAFIGSTPAPLVLLPLEDAMATTEQPNLPGPGDDHPNWRRRWPAHAEDMLEQPAVSRRLQRLQWARNRVEGTRHD
ncbi:4-alpha-glucanotransferase [Pseudomonas daroniae]|uniref:4-alpha-glucanotransferase n=1 Tax=Phytopseudomonas daroniae TaxID=2487519 RepID=A0A4Q9QIU8_9GAMM|nr:MULTISPECIES: 4-alpha-glucanotransferase [Pseudomonas]TBU72798.1 4-alpha-glucanotransferase [Pseudomonas daroniae]TBU77724.1 4-alpha-glucanotransferase [Pseudomonas sp. FRB 228]TBU87686.1 4-alpha-glucanotransferase [Pseudomonas daroniae]